VLSVNSFLNLDSIVDFLESQGMHAVWELGFMPSWLANFSYAVQPRMWYKANPEPPTNYTLWGGVVHDFAAHLVARYGEATAARYPFEARLGGSAACDLQTRTPATVCESPPTLSSVHGL